MGRPQSHPFTIWTIAFVLGLLLVGTVLAMPSCVAACGGDVLCVDADAPGPTHDGSTWTTAYTDLQAALSAAASGNEIWVAEGVYYPAASSGDYYATFSLKSGVAIYGGFAATETLRTQRDWTAYETILSGDVDRNDSQRPVITDTATVTNTESNVYHVVTGATDATLDGFTITAGRTRSCTNCGNDDRGGGMLNDSASPTLSHLVIRGNQAEAGGGMANVDGSNLVLDDVWVHDNSALLDPHGIGWGGGIVNGESCLRISNSRITSNRASAYGGGIGTDNRNYTTCLDGSGNTTFIVSNVEFSGNWAGANGGGMHNYYASPAISDSEFTGNSAAEGGGLGNSRSTATLTDVVIEDNLANSGMGRGGAISNWIDADVTLRRVIIRNNRANSEGGALWNYSSVPTLIDCIVSGNIAIGGTGSTGAYGDGGAIWGSDGSLQMTNVLVSGNCASRHGGAISHWSNTAADLRNVAIVGNRAGLRDGWPYDTGCLGESINVVIHGQGGGIQSWQPTTLENSIVWGNWAQTAGTEQIDTGNDALIANYSIIQDGSAISGTHVLTGDPNFASAVSGSSAPTDTGNYRLEPGSPAIDAGDNTNVTETTDLDGNPRRVDDVAVADTGLGTSPIVDIGPYEYSGTAPELTAVKDNDTGGIVAAGHPFTWTITVTNTGPTAAVFESSQAGIFQVILQDDLPSEGASYGVPVVTGDSSTGISPDNSIHCAVTDGTLRCVPAGTGITVTIGADGGHFTVNVPVTPNAVMELGNPRSGGKCAVDPDGVIVEGLEGNNSCSDSVTAGGVTLVAAIHDAAHNEITSAPLGAPVHGRASFELPAGSSTPTGFVFLRRYDNASCSGTVLATDVKPLVDGVAESSEFSAQSFYYKVSYDGDSTHRAATSACKLFSATQPGPTLTVNTTADDDFDAVCSDIHCTLREAIAAANSLDGANDIRFDVGSDATITLSSELPAIRAGGGAVSIDGETNRITVDGAGAYRMFWATDAARVTLAHLTITDGLGRSCEEYGINTCGSGLKVDAGTVVTLTHSSILNSSAELGGGVTNYGTLNVLHSTLANNTSTGTTAVGGGAIYNQNGAITLQNSTVSGNQAPQGGAIEQRSGGSLTIVNSTIVSNTASNAATSGLSLLCGGATLHNAIIANNNGGNNFSVSSGSFTSQGYNLSDAWNGVSTLASDVTADPELGPLADNGGETWTHAPLAAESPGVDAGDPEFCLKTDQRDEYRPRGSAGDIGAVEQQPVGLSIAKSIYPTADVAYRGVVTYTIVAGNTSIVQQANLVITDSLPSGVTFARWVEEPDGTIRSGDAITWSGTLQAQSAVTLSFVATNTADHLETVTNIAHLADSASPLAEDDASFTVTCPPTVTVTSLNDSGAGSLRQAIADVCSGGSIDFAPALSGSTIVLTTTELVLEKAVTIVGPGESALSISGDAARRVFYVNAGTVVHISDLTITDGKSDTGGGLWNYGTLTLERVTVTNNQADAGGGIVNMGVLTLEEATVSDNQADSAAGVYNENSVGGSLVIRNSIISGNAASAAGVGGGIYNNVCPLTVWNSTLSGNTAGTGGGIISDGTAAGTFLIQNSTFSENSATEEGAGLLISGGTVSISNTVIADSLVGDDCQNYGTISVNTNNLIEDGTCGAPLRGDPLLAPLADYGGNTATHALLPGSPLIDAGASCPATDQRDVARPQIGACDIGAFESRGFQLAYGGGSDQSTYLDTAFAQPLTITVTSAYSEPVSGGRVIFTGPAAGASTVPAVITATVADERVAPAVTANSVDGTYVVTATTRGSLDASIPFTLTNVYEGIALFGDESFIPVGDAAPDSADGTDFGALAVPGEVVTHTFAIRNAAETVRTISDVTLSGPATPDFTVTGMVTPAGVAAGESGTFQVAFDPTVAGTRAVTLTVLSDDAERGSYDFALQGEGIATDLVVTQTASVAEVEPGSGTGNLTYVVALTNRGPSAGTAITVSNALTIPLGVTIDAAEVSSGSHAFAPADRTHGTWMVSDLPAGASAWLTLTLTVGADAPGGTITHGAWATGYALIDTGDDSTTVETRVASRDLGITKTNGVTETVPGTAISYTIVVSNAGPSAVAEALVSDALPPVLADAHWSCAGDGGGTCVPSGTGGLSTTAGLPAGAAVTYTVFATVTTDATGSLANSAMVTVPVGMRDSFPANNAATDEDTLEPQADLTLVKLVSAAEAAPGDPLTYTLIYTNSGPSQATGVVLIDRIPDELRDVAIASSGATITDTGITPLYTWQVSDLAPGRGGIVTVSGVVSLALRSGHTFTNTGALASSIDPQTGDNSATVVVTVLNVAPEAVDNAYHTAEDSVLTVPASGVLENDSDVNGDALSAVLETAPAHGALDLSPDGGFVYTPTADFNGIDIFTYRAGDGRTLSAPATVTVTVEALADLQVQKTADPETVVPGETLTYTVVARNAGPSAASGVTLLDSLPDALPDAVWTCASHLAACPVVSGSGSLSVALDLPAGGVLTYTIVGVVDPAAEGFLWNTAVLTATAGPVDPQPADNTAATETRLVPEADLSIAKSHVLVGDAVTYTIVVHNDGPSDAPCSYVTDERPAGLSGFDWRCETDGVGKCDPSGMSAITDLANLPVGSTVTYTVLSTRLGSAVVRNVAEVDAIQGLTDPDTTNNRAVDQLGGEIRLPVIYKGFVLQPDLVVTAVEATTSAARVIIQNVGTIATVNDFWVDLYFNPVTRPPRINQQWQFIAPAGVAWGVTRSLAPGESLELVTGGDYYWPAQSSPAPYPAGAETWAYVDAVNYATTWGAVRESDEDNNVYGPVETSAGVLASDLPAVSGKPETGNLPARQ